MLPKRLPAFNSIIASSMFHRVILLYIVIISVGYAYGSIADIVESGVFGCDQDTSSYCKRYEFTKLPGLMMDDWEPFARTFFAKESGQQSSIYFGQIIYNPKNKSKYYFGDKISYFSKVMEDFIPGIIDSGRVFDLARLYLMASNPKPEMHYYYLTSEQELSEILESYQSQYDSIIEGDIYISPDIQPKELKTKDIELLNSFVTLPIITSDANNQILKFNTWESYYGNVKSWEFEITEYGFSLKRSKELKWRIGPYCNRIFDLRHSNKPIKPAGLAFEAGLSEYYLSRRVTRNISLPDSINHSYGSGLLGFSGGINYNNIEFYSRFNCEGTMTGGNDGSLPHDHCERFSLSIAISPLLLDMYRLKIKPVMELQTGNFSFEDDSIPNMDYEAHRSKLSVGVKTNLFIKNHPFPDSTMHAFQRIVIQCSYLRGLNGNKYLRTSITLGTSFMEGFWGLGYRYEYYSGLCKSKTLYLSIFSE